MNNELFYLHKPNRKIDFTEVNYNSIESDSSPLVLNVAGCIKTPISHQNLNSVGRKDYYLIYLMQGTLKGKNEDGEATVIPGEIIVLPPKKPYCIDCVADNNVCYLCVHFTGFKADSILEQFGIRLFPEVNKPSFTNKIQSRFKAILDVLSSEEHFKEEESSNLLERLLIEIGRSIKNKESEKNTLSKSVRYINENYTTEIKITDLAKMENMCMTAYNMVFKKSFGISPIKYIINLRIQLAKELLETSNISIKEISLMSGYGNFNYFSRIFKEYTSMTPLEYRKHNSL